LREENLSFINKLAFEFLKKNSPFKKIKEEKQVFSGKKYKKYVF
jgi:hypothetical protein